MVRVDYKKDFIKAVEEIQKSGKSSYEIFTDFCEMAAIAFMRFNPGFSEREERYLAIVGQYKKDHVGRLADMLATLNWAMEEKFCDFLGECFHALELHNKNLGQFFTPYSLSLLSAQLTIQEPSKEEKPLWINEPACGSGSMLIACAQVMKDRGIDYQNDTIVVAQDISRMCYHMAFVQLSLVGFSGKVVCGDTITQEVFDEKILPMTFLRPTHITALMRNDNTHSLILKKGDKSDGR